MVMKAITTNTGFVVFIRHLLVVLQHVELQSISVRSTVRTEQAGVGLLPSVYSNMVIKSVLCASAIRTMRTEERFFSCVCTYVFGHVIFPIRRIATEGTPVKLADASPPAKSRTITVQSHLLGTPNLVIVISSSHKMLSYH